MSWDETRIVDHRAEDQINQVVALQCEVSSDWVLRTGSEIPLGTDFLAREKQGLYAVMATAPHTKLRGVPHGFNLKGKVFKAGTASGCCATLYEIKIRPQAA